MRLHEPSVLQAIRVIQQSLLQVCTDGPEGTKIFPTVCQVFLGPILLLYMIVRSV